MNESPPSPDFPTTHWSRVARAGDASALAELCAAYWYPIYALIRRKGHPPDQALDLTQGYFARIIEKGTISAADPARGRFRTFLRTDCTYFLADHRDHDRALKRGGSIRVLSIDSEDAETRYRHEPAHNDTPDRLFERDWAVSLIDRAMGRVERHYQAGGRAETFRRLQPILTSEPEAAGFARLATDLRTTEGALRTALHRLRARFADELRAEIAETLDHPTPEAIADELRDLFSALGNGNPREKQRRL
jgi:DNA-directed RNA polymerase specialized sigma24 family protein